MLMLHSRGEKCICGLLEFLVSYRHIHWTNILIALLNPTLMISIAIQMKLNVDLSLFPICLALVSGRV